MKIIVFGAGGQMGRVIAWDLSHDPEIEVVGLADKSEIQLEAAKAMIDNAKTRLHLLDIHNENDVIRVMEDYDVGVLSLPTRNLSYLLVEAAVKSGLDLVDILEDYHRRPDPAELEGINVPEDMTLNEYGEDLHQRARKNGVTILDGMGFAPGLSNITLGDGISRMDQPETAVARVGGIPSKASADRFPLKYMTTWAFEHVLREYSINTQLIKDGKVVEVSSLSDRESFCFDQLGIQESLECAVTPGMPSFIHTRPKLSEFSEKTIRWPGHYQAIDILKECGLLDLNPVKVQGAELPPREFLAVVLQDKLSPRENDRDVCVMYNTVTGRVNGQGARINYYLWEGSDQENKISAMGRVTGYPAAIGAKFIGQGIISDPGIIPPEDGITGKVYDQFLNELDKHDIHIEKVTTLL